MARIKSDRVEPTSSNPRVTKNGSLNTCRIVCPCTGQFFTLALSHSNRECFQIFLDEADRALAGLERPRQLLILDNASWHKS